MTCTITQADLGPAFADVDPALALMFIDIATGIVLGPAACQAGNELAWVNCCVDPCLAIKLLASHMIAVTPGSGGEAQLVTSERVGDVAATYAVAESTSGLFAGSIYGRMYAMLLGTYEGCSTARRTFPGAVGGSAGCGC